MGLLACGLSNYPRDHKFWLTRGSGCESVYVGLTQHLHDLTSPKCDFPARNIKELLRPGTTTCIFNQNTYPGPRNPGFACVGQLYDTSLTKPMKAGFGPCSYVLEKSWPSIENVPGRIQKLGPMVVLVPRDLHRWSCAKSTAPCASYRRRRCPCGWRWQRASCARTLPCVAGPAPGLKTSSHLGVAATDGSPGLRFSNFPRSEPSVLGLTGNNSLMSNRKAGGV